ncbi:hypothetical protein UPYG_G00345940 [Umbra pygmaea]|uniref:Thioredoxin reductase 1, cytoplasmic n=1 Tax=Umbra pygmaea TaxID=75934 RepID=A0ABD0VXU1_UMBPY
MLPSGGPYDFDLLVLGGQYGGLALAKEAAAGFGKKVMVLGFVSPTHNGSSSGLTGSSWNMGCITRKLMHQASLLGKAIQDAQKYGWKFEEQVSHGWREMVEAVQQHVQSVSSELRWELKQCGVTFLEAQGEMLKPHTVQATEGNERRTCLTAETIVIATGDRAKYLSIPGAREHCITSDDLFSLANSPGKTLVVGGSSEGLEYAGFLSGLGLEVTVLLGSQLLPGFDHKVIQKVEDHMLVHGVKFLHHHILKEVEQIEAGITGRLIVSAVSIDGRETFKEEFNTVLMAVGREAYTSDIGLDHVGVKYDQESGSIIVNQQEQSSVDHVYALEAVHKGCSRTSGLSLQAGRLLALRLYGGQRTTCDYSRAPTVLFTPMEYAACGLSEEKARLKFGEDDVEVYQSYYWPLEWTVPRRDKNSCYAKVICHISDQERVVGIHVMGPSAGEVIQGFAVALRCGLTKQQLDTTVGLHLVSAQVLTNLTVTQRAAEAMMVRGNC